MIITYEIITMDDKDSSNSNGNFEILKEDVEGLHQLINKYVKVQLIKDTLFYGYVHSIDPVQYSMILLTPEENCHTINIVPGHAIIDVVETQPSPNIQLPERKMATLTTSDDNVKRKNKLISWFKKNLLQVTESGEKILFGNVSILPPYSVSSICTNNPVVAMQIRKIVENMPQDFDPDVITEE